MQAVGSVASIAGGAFQIAGGLNQISAASTTSSVNSTLDQQRATTARQMATADAADIQTTTRKTIGSVRAGAGAAGLVGNDGSPLEAILDNAQTGELNRQRRLWQGEMQARDFMVDAYGEQMKGWQSAQRGYAAIASGASSILNGVSGVSGMFGPGGGGGFTGSTAFPGSPGGAAAGGSVGI